MYPLHKFVPLPFGTYMMYIDHDKKRVDVETIPKDISNYKKKIVNKPIVPSKPSKAEQYTAEKSTSRSEDAKEFAEPSYHMRYLLHDGQVITEQPPYVTLVDKVTGASIKSKAQWIKERPKRWKEVIKLHQIHNPEMTCTLDKTVATKLPTIPVEMEQSHPRSPQAPMIPHRIANQQRLNREMQPHVYKTAKHSRQNELIAARELATDKRRRKVNRIMKIVSEKALSSKRDKSRSNEGSLTTVTGSKTAQRLAGLLPVSENAHVQEYGVKSIGHEGDWRKSNKESRTLDSVPLEAKDWNPRAEQALRNQLILERMGNTVPFQWKEKHSAAAHLGQIANREQIFYVL